MTRIKQYLLWGPGKMGESTNIRVKIILKGIVLASIQSKEWFTCTWSSRFWTKR